jgi:hypothetical protein
LYGGDLAVLGALLLGEGRHAEAKRFLSQALAIWQDRFGPDHYEVAGSSNTTLQPCMRLGVISGRLTGLEHALHINQRILGTTTRK